jgi:aspartate racemase
MKTVGIIGGLSWHSTLAYYEFINHQVAQKQGTYSCPELMLVQTDFNIIMDHIKFERWNEIAEIMLVLARKLEQSGAGFIIIACNTVHKVVPSIEDQVGIPILHIVDAVASKALGLGVRRVALIGGLTTMTDGFFADRLFERQVETLLPDEADQRMIHHALETELLSGVFLPATRAKFEQVIDRLVQRGAGAVILGCTEFGKLLPPGTCSVPLLDTAQIHSMAAAEMSLT